MSDKLKCLLICFFLLRLFTSTVQAQEDELWGEFLPTGQYYTLVDPQGNIVLETGRLVYLQDQYLTADNKLYEVVKLNEDSHIAHTELVEEVDLEVFPWEELRQALDLTVVEGAEEEKKRGTIGIYHTHNAESYVPTDGTDSINGRGGIHRVGAAFGKALTALGIDVDYSEQLHLPHDRGAYRRSRETALELLANGPDAIFDVHRDAAPQGAYALQLKDEWVTRIQFVVGRQNQNLGINRKYAQSLKKIADELYPGLVKGIFFGRGNYNQDLTPLSLLLEVGAHTNSRPAAERGVSLFAEVVDLYFYGPTAEAAGSGQGRAGNRSIFSLLTFVVIGIAVFYVINAGGFGPAWERFIASLGLRKLK